MKAPKPKISVSTSAVTRSLKKVQRKSPEIFDKALAVGALQLLTWSNTGTGRTSKKPPIRTGVLRGSSSVFVGKRLISIYPQAANGSEYPTPARTHSGEKTTITIVWNTDYAAKMHEWKGGWGKFTIQDQDAGNKWATENLKANRNDLMKVIAAEAKKRMNRL